MILTIANVESVIFYNKGIQLILPELNHIFQKWAVGTRIGLRAVAKDALVEFLNSATPEHLDRIGSYLKLPISVQKINSHIVKNLETDAYCLQDALNNMNEFNGNVSIARNGNITYLCLWR